MRRALPRILLAGILLAAVLAGAGLWRKRAKHMPWMRSNVVGSPIAPARYSLRQLQPKVWLNQPLDMALMPGSDRLFIAQQDGRFVSLQLSRENTKADGALDLAAHHQPFFETLGFTFHPGFVTNRFLYVCFCEPDHKPEGTFVSRFTVNRSEPPTIDPASEQIILRWKSGGHNGACLKFGPDGYLYISTGDASPASPPDVDRSGQDISDLPSSILRIDVDHPKGALPYSIPSDNPFVKTVGARPEVFAYGLRNPWRMNFHPATGELFAGDVGYELWEMIYRIKPGGNYGWSLMEGPQSMTPDQKPGPGPILPPLIAHSHSECLSITGGIFYRGRKLPELSGAFLYGDWESGRVWGLRNDGDKVVWQSKLADSTLRVIAFVEAPDQEALVLDYNGGLFQLVRNEEPDLSAGFPKTLGATGLFKDTASQSTNLGVYPYQINAPMWADHATAERWLGVPNWRPLTNSDYPKFPKDTVFAKTLSLELEAGKPASAKRIETQLLHWDGNNWAAYSYRWRQDQSDADLVPEAGTNQVLRVADPSAPGGIREQNWRFSSATECFRCHNKAAGNLLGFNLTQLNTPAEKGPSQLAALVQAGVVLVKSAPNPLPRLTNPYDEGRPSTDRARSWLDVNCSHCHRSDAGGMSFLDFKLGNTTSNVRGVNEAPLRGDFASEGAAIVTGDDPFCSVLYYRINTEGQGHMPHVGPRLVDTKALTAVRAWIQSGLTTNNRLTRTMEAALARSKAERVLLETGLTNLPDEAIKKLLGTTSGALRLAAELDDLKTPPAIRNRILQLAEGSTNAFTKDLLERFLPAAARRKTLGLNFDLQRILTVNGDAARGKLIFNSTSGPQCSRCHSTNSSGRAYGPELTRIAAKYDRAGLLDQILHPSHIISPEFISHRLALTDGTEAAGIVVRENADSVTLRLETLEEVTFPVARIATNQTSRISAMPEGLLQNLTAQEAADLLQYLTEH